MTIETIRQAVNATREALKDEMTFPEVYLFGSYASGNPSQDSDIDLCFLSGKSVDPWQAQIEVRKVIFDRLDTPLDILVFERMDFLNRASLVSTLEHEIVATGIAI